MNLYQFKRLKVNDKIEINKLFEEEWNPLDKIHKIKVIRCDPDWKYEPYVETYGGWCIHFRHILRVVK